MVGRTFAGMMQQLNENAGGQLQNVAALMGQQQAQSMQAVANLQQANAQHMMAMVQEMGAQQARSLSSLAAAFAGPNLAAAATANQQASAKAKAGQASAKGKASGSKRSKDGDKDLKCMHCFGFICKYIWAPPKKGNT